MNSRSLIYYYYYLLPFQQNSIINLKGRRIYESGSHGNRCSCWVGSHRTARSLGQSNRRDKINGNEKQKISISSELQFKEVWENQIRKLNRLRMDFKSDWDLKSSKTWKVWNRKIQQLQLKRIIMENNFYSNTDCVQKFEVEKKFHAAKPFAFSLGFRHKGAKFINNIIHQKLGSSVWATVRLGKAYFYRL